LALGWWREQVASVKARDPAARSVWEIVWCYPGVHALWLHQGAHALYKARLYFPARLLASWSRLLTGIDIHPGAVIGRRVFIDHGMGVVIGETAIVGSDVTMYQGVTLGSRGDGTGKRHPTVGDGVLLSAGATVLGDITVGDEARLGAGTVLLQSVPPGATVVGVPGRVIALRGQPVADDDDRAADALETALAELRARLEAAEARIRALEHEKGEARGPSDRPA
jgi:serine O-acetyltransferase